MNTIKKLFALLALTLAASGLNASDGWITDLDAAKKVAAEQNKHILVDFTGSDWCGWCIKLNKEVFTKDSFKAYASENLVLVEIDFPRGKKISAEQKKTNKKLAQKYGVRGYPTILLLDAEGKEVARTGYKRGGPDKYVSHLKELIGEQEG